jgi:hypothetical protein
MSPAEGGQMLMLHGVIDEHAELSFFPTLRGYVRINLKGIRRINSFGVRSWIEAIRKVPPTVQFEFVECPPPVVDQMNMVAGFLGRGKVASFYAPMVCEPCDSEEDHLFQVAECRKIGGKLPDVACAKCGKTMEVDDLEDQYLLFVREA